MLVIDLNQNSYERRSGSADNSIKRQKQNILELQTIKNVVSQKLTTYRRDEQSRVYEQCHFVDDNVLSGQGIQRAFL